MIQHKRHTRQKALVRFPCHALILASFDYSLADQKLYFCIADRSKNLRLIEQCEFFQCITMSQTPELSDILLIHSESSVCLSNCTVNFPNFYIFFNSLCSFSLPPLLLFLFSFCFPAFCLIFSSSFIFLFLFFSFLICPSPLVEFLKLAFRSRLFLMPIGVQF